MTSNTSTHSISTQATHSSEQAAQWLRQGCLLAYPTESVWGIGCDAYNQAAVEQILAIKQRPAEKGMIVVTDSVERIAPLLEGLDAQQRQQIIESWQPPLDTNQNTNTAQSTSAMQAHNGQRQAHTWLLPIPSHQQQPFPTWITGKHDSIAVRVIHHPQVTQLCANMVSDNNPYGLIVSTSCNPSGQVPASNFEQAYAYFGEQIGYLLGETLGYTLPSQIRDAATGQVIR
ncbi:L-threonylcarbamoyladenylate synthase [Psychrobacter sp. FDAARGOS_221]|uniref:L-threonylcarbamoyladenylate synthase n=1 Tax=Psychrobacter sp. FDAARGOS_221 TaxID=1975705 RepID=UPI000BB566FE|nr:Sua5/YciO/YrdC/YwlC family protein [Psychrobacter sp. FDAARGOS_221]PNK60747.1 tRNA threonylcarbamoyladenosine biosynthesis protein RimN [Psychrobacter sp. FDAARGOS_221]